MEQIEIKFEEILETVKTVNSKDKVQGLGQCINTELDEVLRRVNEYGKGGEISIKIKIQPTERNERNIIAEVTAKAPKGTVRENIFYQDSRGGLYMDDPNQIKLIPASEIRKLNERTNKNA